MALLLLLLLLSSRLDKFTRPLLALVCSARATGRSGAQPNLGSHNWVIARNIQRQLACSNIDTLMQSARLHNVAPRRLLPSRCGAACLQACLVWFFAVVVVVVVVVVVYNERAQL